MKKRGCERLISKLPLGMITNHSAMEYGNTRPGKVTMVWVAQGKKDNQIPTLCVIGKIEGGVKVIDQATPVAIFPATHIIATGKQRAEDENDVIVPYDREPFRAGRSLAPKGDLCRSWSFSTISRWT